MSELKYVYDVYIKATAEEVWQGLTDTNFTRRFFHQQSIQSDWNVGSQVSFHNPDGSSHVGGTILVADRPHVLSYTWCYFPSKFPGEKPSRVTFTIEPQEDCCRLLLVHDDFGRDSKVHPLVSQGWSAILCSLKTLLETGVPLPIASGV